MAVGARRVFLGDGRLCLRYYRRQAGEYLQIVVASILEDACLYVLISLVGIVVDGLEACLAHVVDTDVVARVLIIVAQCVANVGGKGETHVAVYLRLVAEHHHWHSLQTGDKTVVAGNVELGLVEI